MQGKLMPITIEPNVKLHAPSRPVEKINDEICQLMHNMLVSMYHYDGIGLAAVQVGVHLKIIVIDVDKVHFNNTQAKKSNSINNVDTQFFIHNGKPLFMVNAEILEFSKEVSVFEEGCLSLPGIRAEVARPTNIKVRYLDYKGQQQTMVIEPGILAVCVQHEIDHTNGIIFIDHLSRLKKEMLIKKIIKMAKQKSNRELPERGQGL
ncbi:Peptide deformylase [Alphaproteobacteria bacterium]